ncbi:hypothetical protein Q1695_004332 [Nippostrongylus brasiliensis]|nr:hypothetical protein Q1695_004332 [Nippostrongylus brasiliensis]
MLEQKVVVKLLEPAQKGSSIKRCKRDLCDKKAVMPETSPPCTVDEEESRNITRSISKANAGQTVAQLIESSRKCQIPLVLVFVDYRERFDSVEITAVLNALVHTGVPSPYVQLLEECFSNTTTTIQLQLLSKLTNPIEKGVRQGDTIFSESIRSGTPGWHEELGLGRHRLPCRRKRSLLHWMQVARDRAVWKICGPR